MEQTIIMLVLSMGIFVYTIPFWFVISKIKNRNKVWKKIAFIFFPPIVLWVILALSELKMKTFSNVIFEPLIIGTFSALLFKLQTYSTNRFIKQPIMEYILTIFCLVITFLIWIFFPVLPE